LELFGSDRLGDEQLWVFVDDSNIKPGVSLGGNDFGWTYYDIPCASAVMNSVGDCSWYLNSNARDFIFDEYKLGSEICFVIRTYEDWIGATPPSGGANGFRNMPGMTFDLVIDYELGCGSGIAGISNPGVAGDRPQGMSFIHNVYVSPLCDDDDVDGYWILVNDTGVPVGDYGGSLVSGQNVLSLWCDPDYGTGTWTIWANNSNGSITEDESFDVYSIAPFTYVLEMNPDVYDVGEDVTFCMVAPIGEEMNITHIYSVGGSEHKDSYDIVGHDTILCYEKFKASYPGSHELVMETSAGVFKNSTYFEVLLGDDYVLWSLNNRSYSVGDVVDIDVDFNVDIEEFYSYYIGISIYNVNSSDWVEVGRLDLHNGVDVYHYSFKESGRFKIQVMYSFALGGPAYDSFVYSDQLYVVTVVDTDDAVLDVTSGVGVDPGLLMLVGFAVMLGVGMLFLYVSGSGVGALGGMGFTAVIMSVPGSPIAYLPVAVGAIGGLVLILLIIYLVRSG